MQDVRLSVVAPMHNEEGNARALYEAIRETLDKLGQPYEIIFVNRSEERRVGKECRL